MLSLVGVTPPQAMTGAAVIDAAGEPVDLGNRLAFSETNVRGHQLRSVRSRNAKLIQVIAGARDRPDGFEYYRLNDDPRETLNLAARGIPEETELRRRLMAHAAKAKEEAGSATSVPELDRREIRRLRRLGYIRD